MLLHRDAEDRVRAGNGALVVRDDHELALADEAIKNLKVEG